MKTEREKRGSKVARRTNFNLTLMALPGILLLLVFNYLPM